MDAPPAFTGQDLRRARFVDCDLSGAVLRGVDVDGVEIDAPWLLEGSASLLVNGVDVAPLVEAELVRRFPGFELRHATTPDGLRQAWEAVQAAWDAAVARVRRMPDGTVDEQVGGEWSFAETLRHLVMATDVWLRQAVLEVEQPLHPIGKPHADYAADGYDTSVFAPGTPAFDEVLAVRAERVGMVRSFLAAIDDAELEVDRTHPWAPDKRVPTSYCLHVLLREEWSHLRFALRDLDALEPTG
jgi:hypothetical protein